MLLVLGVALGGAVGAVARYLLDVYCPAGVLIANTVGSFVLGLFFGMNMDAISGAFASAQVEWVTDSVFTVVAVGFTGALSTFATVSLRAAQWWGDDQRLRAAGLWAGHILCGLAAAGAGVLLASL